MRETPQRKGLTTVALLALLAFVACTLALGGAMLWYFLIPDIPPQSGPFHWVVVSVVVLVGIGVGVSAGLAGMRTSRRAS